MRLALASEHRHNIQENYHQKNTDNSRFINLGEGLEKYFNFNTLSSRPSLISSISEAAEPPAPSHPGQGWAVAGPQDGPWPQEVAQVVRKDGEKLTRPRTAGPALSIKVIHQFVDNLWICKLSLITRELNIPIY